MKSEKRAGTLINATGRDKTQSVIFLDNGSVIASPYSVTSLLGSIEKAVAREPGSRRHTPNRNVVHAFDAVLNYGDEDKPEQE
jgi:hypothetical protein